MTDAGGGSYLRVWLHELHAEVERLAQQLCDLADRRTVAVEAGADAADVALFDRRLAETRAELGRVTTRLIEVAARAEHST